MTLLPKTAGRRAPKPPFRFKAQQRSVSRLDDNLSFAGRCLGLDQTRQAGAWEFRVQGDVSDVFLSRPAPGAGVPRPVQTEAPKIAGPSNDYEDASDHDHSSALRMLTSKRPVVNARFMSCDLCCKLLP